MTDTLRVTLQVRTAGGRPGDSVDLPADRAAALVDGGYAVLAFPAEVAALLEKADLGEIDAGDLLADPATRDDDAEDPLVTDPSQDALGDDAEKPVSRTRRRPGTAGADPAP